MTRKQLNSGDFGAWVLKCNPATWDITTEIEMGLDTVTGWTVANNYRKDLMRRGQPVLFWISGSKKGEVVYRGLWGAGSVVASPQWEEGMSERRARSGGWLRPEQGALPGYTVSVDIPLFIHPIPADEFTRDPILANCELVKAQQMSNPVYLNKVEYRAAKKLMRTWGVTRLPENDASVRTSGAGFGSPEQNKKVEAAAMKAVRNYYEAKGYLVSDVSKRNLGWDLTAVHDGRRQLRLVEVKGVSGSRPRILLTRNEARAMDDARWELAVVTGALARPKVRIYSSREARRYTEPFAWEADLPR